MAEQDRHKGALDSVRQEFLFLSIKEMVVEFSEKVMNAGETPGQTSSGRLLVLPANDEADEITAAMLVQLLELAGCAAIPFSMDSLLQERIATVNPSEQDMFCIAALPPFAFAGAINLSRQLQLRFPRTKVMVGVWGFAGNAERALQRFQPSRPHALVTSLADAVKCASERLTISGHVTAER
jgi:methanogenic corrinoid protein MtbC1